MTISLSFHTDAAIQVPVTTSAINHLIDGSSDPQTFVFYLASANPANKFQKSTDPGIDDLLVDIINVTALWTATTAKIVNNTVRTTAKNGYRYKVQSIAGAGNTGASEPAWPTTIGQTVVDGDVTWINDGKIHESTEIKVALSAIGLDLAVAGDPVILGPTINGGVLNAIPVYVRIDDATTAIAAFTELGIAVLSAEETPI